MRLGQEGLLCFWVLFVGFFPPSQPWHIVLVGRQTHTFMLGSHYCAQFVAWCGWQEGKAVHFPVLPIKSALPQDHHGCSAVSHHRS